MKVEPIRSPSGRSGWTVTWKGRGWDRPFDDYLALVRSAGELTRAGILAIPSAKFHLPLLDESFAQRRVPAHHGRVARAWGEPALALEKDFSPTLAGDPLADERGRVLRWLAEVPARYAPRRGTGPVRLALKLMNARYDDCFPARHARRRGPRPTRWSASIGSGPPSAGWPMAAGAEPSATSGSSAAAGRTSVLPPLAGERRRLLRPASPGIRPRRLRKCAASHLFPASALGVPRHRAGRDPAAPCMPWSFTRRRG